MANKASRNFQKNIGFELKKGITRKKMVSHAINKKKIIPPKGVNPKSWLENRLKAYSKTTKETKFETTSTKHTSFAYTQTIQPIL